MITLMAKLDEQLKHFKSPHKRKQTAEKNEGKK